MTVPNQIRVQIIKSKADKKNLYKIVNLDADTKAMKKLSGSGYKLWSYLSKNQDGYLDELSPVAFENYSGVKRSTYYTAKEELIAAGYLVQKECGSNIYFFYEACPEIGHGINTSPEIGHPCPENRHASPEINIEILQNNTNTKTILQKSVMEEKNAVKTKEEVTQWQTEVVANDYQKQFQNELLGFARRLPICGKDAQQTVSQIQQLRDSGRSYEWIAKGLALRNDSDWLAGGFGLLIGKSANCTAFQAKIGKQILVPKEYTEEELSELQKPSKIIEVTFGQLNNARAASKQSSSIDGLYDLNSVLEM